MGWSEAVAVSVGMTSENSEDYSTRWGGGEVNDTQGHIVQNAVVSPATATDKPRVARKSEPPGYLARFGFRAKMYERGSMPVKWNQPM